MSRAPWWSALLLLACGTRAPEPSSAPAPPAPADASVADAARTAAADGGAAPEPVADAGPTADASLAELGLAPCQAVILRFMSCPGVPEDSKQQMAGASRRWHQEAQKSQESREKLAAACLEMARMTEQMLLDLGC
jgi:hypothetical protein